jgi:hypothetical protein
MESNFYIFGIFHMTSAHGQSLYSIWVMSRFSSSCKKHAFTLGRWPLSSMYLGHVFSSNVLTDERVSYTHVSPLVSNGLPKGLR